MGPGTATACVYCKIQKLANSSSKFRPNSGFIAFMARIWEKKGQLGNNHATVADGIYKMYNAAPPGGAADSLKEARIFQTFIYELSSIWNETGLKPKPQWGAERDFAKIADDVRMGQFQDADRLTDAGTDFYFFGELIGTPNDRIYIHPADGKATKVMAFLVPVLKLLHNERRIGLVWAKITGPLTNRLDTIVVYLQSPAEQTLVISEIQAAIRTGRLAAGDFVQGTPAMTKEVLPGIATGSEPMAHKMDLNLQFSSPGFGTQSFGTLRADLLAQALIAARMLAEFYLKVETLFWQNGIRMDNPAVQTDSAQSFQQKLQAVRALREQGR
jgi:hypothetical protein